MQGWEVQPGHAPGTQDSDSPQRGHEETLRHSSRLSLAYVLFSALLKLTQADNRKRDNTESNDITPARHPWLPRYWGRCCDCRGERTKWVCGPVLDGSASEFAAFAILISSLSQGLLGAQQHVVCAIGRERRVMPVGAQRLLDELNQRGEHLSVRL